MEKKKKQGSVGGMKIKRRSVGGSYNTFLTLDIRNRYNIIITMQEEKRFCGGMEKDKKSVGKATPRLLKYYLTLMED